MAHIIRRTPNNLPIAAWMVQANPTVFDVGTAMAESQEAGDRSWTWTCRQTYRLSMIKVGQPAFLWVTRNSNPALSSGIWLRGHVSDVPYLDSGSGNRLWRDAEASGKRTPYLPMELDTLKTFVAREELMDHPIVASLEILRSP